MHLTQRDIICCPPPLFHCFGLVLGLLAAVTHGSSIVFPSETFQPLAAIEAVSREHCTALHGVPAMFAAELELAQQERDFSSLRTGIVAGAPVAKKMMVDLANTFNMLEATNTYGTSANLDPRYWLADNVSGMTETSPASFMTFTDDPLEKRLSTVGKILPHMKAKIVDRNGDIVPVGSRGELCVAGYALQKGYWRNPEKTAEAMRADEDGTIWIHTGDEAVFDNEGYCRIMGRIKDIIIRGIFYPISPIFDLLFTWPPSTSRRRKYLSPRDRGALDAAPSNYPGQRHWHLGSQIRRSRRCISAVQAAAMRAHYAGAEKVRAPEIGMAQGACACILAQERRGLSENWEWENKETCPKVTWRGHVKEAATHRPSVVMDVEIDHDLYIITLSKFARTTVS